MAVSHGPIVKHAAFDLFRLGQQSLLLCGTLPSPGRLHAKKESERKLQATKVHPCPVHDTLVRGGPRNRNLRVAMPVSFCFSVASLTIGFRVLRDLVVG